MPADDQSKKSISSNAEAAFAEFLRRRELGENLDFEAFCADRPELADALCVLYSLHCKESLEEGELEHTFPVLGAKSDRNSSLSTVDITFPFPDTPPESIGNYTILQVLGEGGMGVVYLAEQREPVRRRVALKLIKLGMDTKEVIARFEVERQALALMNHPNIAKVYDAGAAEDGRPYFVMEHVQGVPSTDYCDRHRLTVKERLELFTQICHGIQHAHHKGIIHRDIKPSNVLVTIPDDEPVAKIIDFGVAKATNQRLTEKTLYTQLGRAVGTPAYMSPEQAEMTAEDVDSRTDIYSLGVFLYELLVGELPFDWESLSKAAFEEILRTIREDEPPTPSTHWSRLNVERITKLATQRRTNPPALASELRGDLDWITMKAIEKDRNRRYSTVSELAADIFRHLKHEPVVASPPSVAYRIQKYLRKNRGPITAVGTVMVVLVLGLLVSLSMYFEAEQARTSEAERAGELEKARVIAQARLDEVLRLSDVKRLADYIAEAESLWPAVPEKVQDMEGWLKKAGELQARLVDHRWTLAALQEKALHYDDATKVHDWETHPRAAELKTLKEKKEKTIAEARKIEEAGGTARVISYGDDSQKKHSAYYFRHAFNVEEPVAHKKLQLRLVVDDGAVIYLNGFKILRVNLPEEVNYKTLASETIAGENDELKSHEVSGEYLKQGQNNLAVEVHQASSRSSDLRFDLELVAFRMGGEEVTLVSKGSSWRYHDRGEDLKESWRAPDYDHSAWSKGKGPLGYGFQKGPGRAVELRQAHARLDQKIAELEDEVFRRRTWRFGDTELQWQHDTLAELVASLEAFADPDPKKGVVASVKERLKFARTVYHGSVADHREAWERAIRSIADRRECPHYNGIKIQPQVGLIPIGRDPDSGLWEFAHLQTGKLPERGADGKLVLREESGLVFVLIPGGTFRMGAVKPSKDQPEGSPNVDPHASSEESPIHEVTLEPFFISKYEMSQGQWLRFTGENPSIHGPHRSPGGKQVSLLHPVENISWEMCYDVLSRLGLLLPTEAQWENAARGGTKTVWWTGNDKKSLKGAANLADLFLKKSGGLSSWKYEEWLDDGFAGHAPVGSFRGNPFGLHDVVGNVGEWCSDSVGPLGTRPGSYEKPARVGDGKRLVEGARNRVLRGGGWGFMAFLCRSAVRGRYSPDYRFYTLGVRPVRAIVK